MNELDSLLKTRTIFDYWLVIYERRYTIAVVVASAVALAIGLSLTLPAVYEARATFYVPSPMAQPLLEKGAVPPFPSGIQDEAKAYVTILRGNNIQARIRQKFPGMNPAIFARGIDFSATREGIITIYVRDRDPKLGATVANEYITAFDKFSEENARSQIRSSLSAVELQIGELERQLKETTLVRRQFREKYSVATAKGTMDELVNERLTLDKELQSARVTFGSINGQLDTARRPAGDLNSVSGETGVNYPVLDSLRKTLGDVEIELAGKTAELKDNHPTILALRSRQAQAKLELQRELERLRSDKQAQVDRLQTLVKDLDGKIQEWPAIIAEGDRLDQDIQRYADLLNTSLKQREDLKIQGVKGYGGTVTVDIAFAPTKPVFPNIVMNVIMAFILGVIGGVLYAFSLEYLESVRRVRRLRGLELARLLELRKIEVREGRQAVIERVMF